MVWYDLKLTFIHWTQFLGQSVHSLRRPIVRNSGENRTSIRRQLDAQFVEQQDEWLVQHCGGLFVVPLHHGNGLLFANAVIGHWLHYPVAFGNFEVAL